MNMVSMVTIIVLSLSWLITPTVGVPATVVSVNATPGTPLLIFKSIKSSLNDVVLNGNDVEGLNIYVNNPLPCDILSLPATNLTAIDGNATSHLFVSRVGGYSGFNKWTTWPLLTDVRRITFAACKEGSRPTVNLTWNVEFHKRLFMRSSGNYLSSTVSPDPDEYNCISSYLGYTEQGATSCCMSDILRSSYKASITGPWAIPSDSEGWLASQGDGTGQWVWETGMEKGIVFSLNGTVVTYAQWGPGEPSDPWGCVYMNRGGNWSTRPCTDSVPSVCIEAFTVKNVAMYGEFLVQLTTSVPVPVNTSAPGPNATMNITNNNGTAMVAPLPPKRDHSLIRRIIDPSFAYPAMALSIPGPSALDAMQSLVAIGLSACSPAAMKSFADEQCWILAPLYRITGKANYFGEPPSVTPILANVFTGAVFVVLHRAAAYRLGCVPTMFPALSLLLGGTLAQGTTFYSARHLSTAAGTGWDAVAVAALIAGPGLLVGYAVRFYWYFAPPRSNFERYRSWVVDAGLWQRVFLPRGFHVSREDVATDFPLFDHFAPHGYRAIFVKYACLLGVGVVTAVPAEGGGCDAVVAVLATIFAATALYNFIHVPTRIRLFSITRGVTAVLSLAIVTVGYWSMADDVVGVLANVLMVVNILELVAMLFPIWWEQTRGPEARVSPDGPAPSGTSVEMAAKAGTKAMTGIDFTEFLV